MYQPFIVTQRETQIFSTAHTQPHTHLLASWPDHIPELAKQHSSSSGVVLASIWQIYRAVFFLRAMLWCIHQLLREMLCFALFLLNASLYSPACLPSPSFVAGQIPCAGVFLIFSLAKRWLVDLLHQAMKYWLWPC